MLFFLSVPHRRQTSSWWLEGSPAYISAHTSTVCSGLPVCGLTLQCVDLEIGEAKVGRLFSWITASSLSLSPFPPSPAALSVTLSSNTIWQAFNTATSTAKLKYLITIHQYNSNITGRLKDNTSVTTSFIFSPCSLYPCFTGRGDCKAPSQTDKRKDNHFSFFVLFLRSSEDYLFSSPVIFFLKVPTKMKPIKKNNISLLHFKYFRETRRRIIEVKIFIGCKLCPRWHFGAMAIMNENVMPSSYLCCLFIFDKYIQLQHSHTYTLCCCKCMKYT